MKKPNLFQGYGVKKLMLFAAAAPSFTKRPGFPYGVTRNFVNQLIYQAKTDRPKLAWDFSHNQLFASPHSEPLKDWFQDISLSASGIGTVKTGISLRDEDGRRDLAFVHVPTAIFGMAQSVFMAESAAGLKGILSCGKLKMYFINLQFL